MILVDTHTLLWLLEDDQQLGDRARDLITTTDVRFVSAVSFVEVAIKAVRGRLRVPTRFESIVADQGFLPLPLHDRHALGLLEFESLVGHDPFDRMLIAQAHVERATLVTADRVLLSFDHTFDATT